MNLLSKIEIQNFLCFRKEIKVDLKQATYLIGTNNSGKTAILNAIRFFFDDNYYFDDSFLNRSELISRQTNYNKATISITFELNALKNKRLKTDLKKIFGDTLRISKITTYKEATGKIESNYKIPNKTKSSSFEKLSNDIQKVLSGVKINYLHPQEGKELLENAQRKLTERLFANWGRDINVTNQLRHIQEQWHSFKSTAGNYLSNSITSELQTVWKNSVTKIGLPKTIQELIKVSDISFQGGKDIPEVNLTSQGTGAQSTILYHAHYLLDSDATLHRGEYYPVWLLEEPESFLHADLAANLGQKLNSEQWLSKIQMVISTHSPLILATSRLAKEKAFWNLLDNHNLKKGRPTLDWTEEEIGEIGIVMGDSNFEAYFSASQDSDLIYLEDSRELTFSTFKKSKIAVTQKLDGINDVKKYIEVLKAAPYLISKRAFFIVDNDCGFAQIKKYVSKKAIKQKNGFCLYGICKNGFVITLPESYSSEDLFSEYPDHVRTCASHIFDEACSSIQQLIPRHLVQCAGMITHGNTTYNSISEVASKIWKHKEVKDEFWKRVKNEGLALSDESASSIQYLLE